MVAEVLMLSRGKIFETKNQQEKDKVKIGGFSLLVQKDTKAEELTIN